eukprot:CAMPEP_0182443216 /NCGR_PEP_ID=MMETSP1172-20130603/1996_1 /TAXON_ID=708627 /ORGANISM="Timspurckia oligopyrenoides, Strain CCMP3278" /LENGTH=377 /DNA_ID=CAMNT_0024638405 /DNA_START=126 /DNA_END=1259 /DNA_ORIENTATION=+
MTDSSSKHVVILGGGIIGSSIAYYLMKLKQNVDIKVTVVEAVEVAASASGKAGGFLAPHWGSGSVTDELHRVSFELHKELASELNLESFRMIPTLEVSFRKKIRKMSEKSMKRDKPEWLQDEVSSKLMDDSTAQVYPYELTTKLMNSAMENGCELKIGKVSGFTKDLESNSVNGICFESSEILKCDEIVIAMGMWSTVCTQWLGYSLPMEGIQSTSVIYKSSEAVDKNPYALFCAEDRNGCHLEVYPRSNGEVYVCGIGGSLILKESDVNSEQGTDSAVKVKPDESRVRAATDSLSKIMNASQNIIKTQACIRPCTIDAIPVLGKLENHQNVFLASGHNCWGILWAPATGKSMAELILTGSSNTINLKPFSPSRFSK